ncbi:MAG TPA: ubiquinone/menaquinone biosynthesis methyltransferase [Acidimicrobiales bacterium]|nr:ubiquinone/menaquinone biosynthesis methyltransferase [Acidimicrobiales bacterium]
MPTTPDAATQDEHLPEGAEKRAYVQEMFDRIAPRYDLLNTLMTFGLDRRWRVRTVRALGLAPGQAVLDLASGTGPLLATLRARGLRALGADLSYEMLAAGGARAAGSLQGDAAALPLAGGALDGVVSGFALRNFADLGATFAELARVLRPGGRLAILEVDRPANPLLRLGHRLWFERVVPRLGALLSDARAYAYLPRSVAYLPDPSALATALEAAGFTAVTRLRLSGGLTQVVTATRRGDP